MLKNSSSKVQFGWDNYRANSTLRTNIGLAQKSTVKEYKFEGNFAKNPAGLSKQLTKITTSSKPLSVLKGTLVKGIEHVVIHEGIHVMDHAIKGFKQYAFPKLVMFGAAADGHKRLTNSENSTKPASQRFVCANVGTGIKTATTIGSEIAVNVIVVAAAPETMGSSLLLRGVGHVGAEILGTAAGNVAESACHKTFEMTHKLEKIDLKALIKSKMGALAITPQVPKI